MYTTRVLGACSKGNIVLLEELSREGNIKSCLDKFGASGVHYAVRAGQLECLVWLVNHMGLDPLQAANNGFTPMHDAAATGQLECLKWLINSAGCHPNSRDSCRANPLHLAARFGHLPIVSWLVESEFCRPLDGAQNGVTAVHLASAKGSLFCLRWLLQRNPRMVDVRSDNGATPAYFASQEGRLDCLKFLIQEMKGDPKLRTVEGLAPVHAAAQMGQVACLTWLIEHASVSVTEKDKDGATPLHFAAARGHVKVVQWLLHRRSAQEKDDFGSTPLHDAAEHGQLESVKLLLKHGANVNVKDRDGMTPSVLAKECGHLDCSSVLSRETSPTISEQPSPSQPVASLENPTSRPHLTLGTPPIPHLLGRRGSDCLPTQVPSLRRHYSWKSSSSSESGSSGEGTLRHRTLQYLLWQQEHSRHNHLQTADREKVLSGGNYRHHPRARPITMDLTSFSPQSTTGSNPHKSNGSALSHEGGGGVGVGPAGSSSSSSEVKLPQWKRELLGQRKLEDSLALEQAAYAHPKPRSPSFYKPASSLPTKVDQLPGNNSSSSSSSSSSTSSTKEDITAVLASLPEWKRKLMRRNMPSLQM